MGVRQEASVRRGRGWESGRACAGAGTGRNTDAAAASALAGVAVALVGLDLAAQPREAGPAAAGVAPLAGVGAGGAVLARPVVGAVVQVLVAEEAPPALLAVALPGLRAGAVEAARVADAVLAEGALPADPALALAGLLAVAVAVAAAGQADGWREASRGEGVGEGSQSCCWVAFRRRPKHPAPAPAPDKGPTRHPERGAAAGGSPEHAPPFHPRLLPIVPPGQKQSGWGGAGWERPPALAEGHSAITKG